jgi:hypothetical protein
MVTSKHVLFQSGYFFDDYTSQTPQIVLTAIIQIHQKGYVSREEIICYKLQDMNIGNYFFTEIRPIFWLAD